MGAEAEGWGHVGLVCFRNGGVVEDEEDETVREVKEAEKLSFDVEDEVNGMWCFVTSDVLI